MSNSAQDPSWGEYDTLKHSIKGYTVDKLKQIITGLSDECGISMVKSGRKQDLIDKITRVLETFRAAGQVDRWNRARGVVHQVRTTGCYQPPTSHAPLAPAAVAQASHFNAHRSPKRVVEAYNANHASGPSAVGRFEGYLGSRPPLPPPAVASAPSKQGPNPIRFKPSPFFHIDQRISDVIECPESTNSTDRKSQTVLFHLTQEQLNKLSQSSPKYQLRLYCTSSTYYHPTAPRPNSEHCLIEFPSTCDVRVNNTPLSANLKGVKKKAGTAPPADLGRSVRHVAGIQNRVDMIYINSQQASLPKKYYLVVYLVETRTVEQLVTTLRKGKYKSLEDVKSRMAKSASDDDEIVAGNQTMSLKCPLSYCRIQVPCRSDKCVHSQCFDATSWYAMMEQTTTWACPICEKTLNTEELIVDGYFDDILKRTPESVEEVVIEPDGEWYSPDKKYTSSGPKAIEPNGKAPPAVVPAGRIDDHTASPGNSPKSVRSNGASISVGGGNEVFVLDSDDEDEGRVKRELSPTYGTEINCSNKVPPPPRPKAANSEVIDLTLDSDAEDDPQPPTKAGKRRADESPSSNQSPKRVRTELPSAQRRPPANGFVNDGPAKLPAPPPGLPRRPTVSSASHSPTVPNVNPAPASAPPVAQQPAPYPPGRYPYPPYPPAARPPGLTYDPQGHSHDPRQYPYLPAGYNNPYLPRAHGSTWP